MYLHAPRRLAQNEQFIHCSRAFPLRVQGAQLTCKLINNGPQQQVMGFSHRLTRTPSMKYVSSLLLFVANFLDESYRKWLPAIFETGVCCVDEHKRTSVQSRLNYVELLECVVCYCQFERVNYNTRKFVIEILRFVGVWVRSGVVV